VPIYLQTITVARLEAGKRGSAEGLQAVYNDVFNWVGTECQYVIPSASPHYRVSILKMVVPVVRRQLLDITHTSVHGFDFLSNAIWAEVPRHAHLPSLRSP